MTKNQFAPELGGQFQPGKVVSLLRFFHVRTYLEKTKLTGLWVYNSKKAVYDFYEPSLSDIPNAAIMFHEDYVISAEFNPKTKILTYRRFQF